MLKGIIVLGCGHSKSETILAARALREAGMCSEIVMVDSMDRNKMKELSAELVEMRAKEIRQRLDVEITSHLIVDNPIKFDQKRESQQGWKKKHKQR